MVEKKESKALKKVEKQVGEKKAGRERKSKDVKKRVSRPEKKVKKQKPKAAKPKVIDKRVVEGEGAIPKPEKKVKKPREKPGAIKKKKLGEKKEKPIEKIRFTGKKELSEGEKPLMKKRFNERKGKPKFMRQEFHKLKRLGQKWRRPRGIDSKRQDGQKSKGAVPAIGYGKTLSVRGIHPSGYYPVLVGNPEELEAIKSDKEAAIISASVGRKKRNLIIKQANELNIAILNPRKGEL